MNSQDTFAAWLNEQRSHKKSVALSIVIPAYNEALRLPLTLMQLITYLDTSEISYEVIVVDDGSRDNTSELVLALSRLRPAVRSIRLPRNYGKGHAVRTGMLSAQGDYVLFCDADGATPWSELNRLFAAIKSQNAEVAFGSRAMPSSDTTVEARSDRKFIGRFFNFLVNSLVIGDVKDSQCGFKLFSAGAAKFIFEKLTLNRFAFDVELIYVAKKAGIPIIEVPVNWHHVAGSKVNLIWDSLQMFKDIVIIKMRHRGLLAGSWKTQLK